MYKPSGIPPIQNIQDRPTRDALAALAEVTQVRNSATDDGFVSRAEMQAEIRKQVASLRVAAPSATEVKARTMTSATNGVTLASDVDVVLTDPYVNHVLVKGSTVDMQIMIDNLRSANQMTFTAIHNLVLKVDYLESVLAGMNKP